MNVNLFKVALLGMLLFSLTISAKDKRYFEKVKIEGKEIGYNYYLPKNYDAKKYYPVLILPGDGVEGAEANLFAGDNPTKYEWIVVESFIQLNGNAIDETKVFLDYLLKKFKVNENKFHIVGFSANSSPTYEKVFALPQYFKSVTGIPGHPRTNSDKELIKLKNITVQLIVGANDSYWRSESEKAYNKLKQLGINTILEVVPGAGHVIEKFIGDEFLKRIDKLK